MACSSRAARCSRARLRPRGVRYAERFRTSCWNTEARYAPGLSTLWNRTGGGARGNGLRHRQGSPRVDQIVPGSRRNLRCLGAHLHLRAELEARRGDLPGGGWLLRSQRGLLRAGPRLKLGGGLRPPSEPPPSIGIARAKPALELTHQTWRTGWWPSRIPRGSGEPIRAAR